MKTKTDKNMSKKRSLQTKLTGGTIFPKKAKPEDYVICPVCEAEINSTLIHLHIESCLLKTSEKESREVHTSGSFTATSCREPSTQSSSFVSAETEYTCTDMCPDISLVEITEVPGLWLIHNFISEEEEAALVRLLDDDPTPWHFSSFNGICNSKSYGVKTQFGTPGEERCVRRNNPAVGEFDIPAYLAPLPVRLQLFLQQQQQQQQQQQAARVVSCCPGERKDLVLGLHVQSKRSPPPEAVKFMPNECNANSYEAKSKHYLRAHFDDRILSGPILMNLSLLCDSRMTYHLASSGGSSSKGGGGTEVPVYLPRRTLQLVTGAARWKYRHSIKAEDVLGDRRVSVTWRHSESKSAGIRHGARTSESARGMVSRSKHS